MKYTTTTTWINDLEVEYKYVENNK